MAASQVATELKRFQILKAIKIVFSVFCMLCAAILVNSGYTNSEWNFCLAAAIIWFITELIFLILYLTPLGKLLMKSRGCGICRLIYHVIIFIFVFAACVCLVMAGMDSITAAAIKHGSGNETMSMTAGYKMAAQGYNAFGIFTLIGFSIDIYWNIQMLHKGSGDGIAGTIMGIFSIYQEETSDDSDDDD